MTKANPDNIAATAEDKEKIESRLRILDAETLFRVGYGSYEYLRDMETPVSSGTYGLLQKLKTGDSNTILKCITKMIEERDELTEAVLGAHYHEGETQEEILLTELQQTIYWPTLIAVGARVPFDTLKFMDFFDRGYDGQSLVHIDDEIGKGCEESMKNQIVLLRQALVFAGDKMFNYNMLFPGREVKPEDVAKHDLKQMLQRPYLYEKIKKDLGA